MKTTEKKVAPLLRIFTYLLRSTSWFISYPGYHIEIYHTYEISYLLLEMSIIYLTYLCIFGICLEYPNSRKILSIQWTALHARHVLWYGFLGSGEFFTRTKETHLTVVLFQAFQKSVVSVGFLDLHLFIVHECSLYFCYEFCCLYVYPVYFHQ